MRRDVYYCDCCGREVMSCDLDGYILPYGDSFDEIHENVYYRINIDLCKDCARYLANEYEKIMAERRDADGSD